MPRSTLIVPWADKDGKPHAAGEEVELSDEEYRDLRADGKIANTEEPYQGEPGHYGDRTVRPGEQAEQPPAGQTTEGAVVNSGNPPTTEDDEPDEPVHRSTTRKR